MRKLWISGVLAALCIGPVFGLELLQAKVAIRISPLPERVALASCIVTGKVTEIEEKKISAHQFPGVKEKVEYTIAVVEIKDGLLGAKGVTHVKVGFVEPQAAPGDNGRDAPIRRPPIRFQPVTLAKNQEGCFLLTPHFEETFYTAPAFDYVINKQDNANYDKELDTIKQCAKLLADPDAGLKSKDAGDRFLTAALLVIRYRTPTGANPKEEKVDAPQSKLILQGLADGDWSKGFSGTDLTPMMVFPRLNLTDKDNWKPVAFQNYEKDFPEYAKKWIKDNGDSYAMKRFVEKKN
jgi:hypothetical protein